MENIIVDLEGSGAGKYDSLDYGYGSGIGCVCGYGIGDMFGYSEFFSHYNVYGDGDGHGAGAGTGTGYGYSYGE